MGLTSLYLNAEAALARRWPRRVQLRENMKGEVQERSLMLHLPYSGAGAAAVTSPDSARANARAAGAAVDQAAPVWALKRPLPFERAVQRCFRIHHADQRQASWPICSLHVQTCLRAAYVRTRARHKNTPAKEHWHCCRGWQAPPLPLPRISPRGELVPCVNPDTSGVEASSWLLAPLYHLNQVLQSNASMRCWLPLRLAGWPYPIVMGP